MSTPLQAPTPDPRGSLGKGIAIAWAVLIGGYVVIGSVIGALVTTTRQFDGDLANALAIGAIFVPWLAMIALIIRYAAKNQPRTAAGIGVGMASIVGVVLLLIAACFGLLSSTNFH
jgi:hypothetical protein